MESKAIASLGVAIAILTLGFSQCGYAQNYYYDNPSYYERRTPYVNPNYHPSYYERVYSVSPRYTIPVRKYHRHKVSRVHTSQHHHARVFVFDPRTRSYEIKDATGKVIKTGRASGGKNYCEDVKRRCHSPVGRFRIYSKGGPGCKSTKFPIPRGGAPMPYCAYFHKGFAIHGSYEVRSYNASHGCIRITPSDAQWLHHNLPIGSTVIIKPY